MIKPINNRVLIEIVETESENSSGIEIVKYAKTKRSSTTSTGTVLASGVESIAVGSIVIFDEGWGNEIETGLFLVPEDNVKAYVNE